MLYVSIISCPYSITEQERKERLEEQAKSNEYHRFADGHLILKQGFIDKRKVFMNINRPTLYHTL